MDNFEISNLSYTNKDFQTIFIEMLDLVKKITYRWDPTISNESDPGVILLKLNALIADKCNYNIDKNVLECFPESVTQDSNARQLFEQLGYVMKQYQAATTTVSMRWIGDIDDPITTESVFNIPKFTMVTNDERDIVYTIAEEKELPVTGDPVTAIAYQGVAVNYDINGETIITARNLDSMNRLYFSDINVAENAIFISNVGQNNYASWRKVNNLYVEPLNQRIYKFDMSIDGSVCYIEFPEDIEALIGDGINITYLKTDGYDGNIGVKILEKLYQDIQVRDILAANSNNLVTLDSSNLYIENISAGVGGEYPEDIDSAYKNYKRTIGTFNTLVTLRDYINAILNYELASNGFVCDRTNDIQNYYRVVTTENDLVSQRTVCRSDDMLSAFDLKLYVLEYRPTPNNLVDYNATFSMLSDISTIESYLADEKSLQHDFGALLDDRICMIKNKYPVSVTIIPQYKLTDTQSTEVSNNISTALFEAFNSQELEFGEYISYDMLYDTIQNADNRIKSIILDNIEYTSYAVYLHDRALYEVIVSDNYLDTYRIGSYDSETHIFTPFDGKKFNIYNDTGMDESYNIYAWDGNIVKIDTLATEMFKKFRSEIYAKAILAGNTPMSAFDQTYLHSLTQEKQDMIDNISVLDTNTDIIFENSGDSYTLKDHENLIFMKPNLLDALEYSGGVKFQYRVGSDIPANSQYQLIENEKLVFYWKDSDEDQLYQYRLYGAGTIIKPNFFLPTMTDTMLIDNTSDPHGAKYASKNASDIISSWSILDGNHGVLNSVKSIVIQKLAQVSLEKTNCFCTWITNTADADGNYVLFDSDPESPYYNTRVLKTDEYFIYTNLNKNTMNRLGAGTRLYRNTESTSIPYTKWIVPAISATSIYNYGIDAITGRNKDDAAWFTIPDTFVLAATENAITSLGTDVVITISDATDTSAFPLKFNNTGAYQKSGDLWVDADLKNYTIQYQYGTADPVEMERLNLSDVTYNWIGYSLFNLSLSSTQPQILNQNQSITYRKFDGSGGTLTAILDPETSDYKNLYVLSDREINRDGGTSLNVLAADGSGQIKYLELYTYTEASLSDAGDQIQKFDDVITITFDQEHRSAELNFKLPAGNYIIPIENKVEASGLISEVNCVFSPDGYIQWKLDATYDPESGSDVYDGSTATQLATPESIHAIGSEHLYNSYLQKSWTASSQIHTINDLASSDIGFPGVYYFNFTVPENLSDIQTLTISIVLEDAVESNFSCTMNIGNITKYEPSTIKVPYYDDIITAVKYYDEYKMFKYDYKPDDDDLIINPLSAESFLNTAHPYNKFTICQLNTNDSQIQVTNKIRG